MMSSDPGAKTREESEGCGLKFGCNRGAWVGEFQVDPGPGTWKALTLRCILRYGNGARDRTLQWWSPEVQ